MNSESPLSAFVTLLVTVDPVGLSPVFLSLTAGMASSRRMLALRATVISFTILTCFVLVGHRLLSLLGIGLPAFRIGGGIMLFWIAFEMVFEGRSERKKHAAERAVGLEQARDVAAFPLAIPLMAGPGAITAVILLASRVDHDVVAVLLLIALIAGVMLLCFTVFALAVRLSAMLGRTGTIVLTRLLGVLLTALSVQFVIDGIRALTIAGCY